LPRVPPPAYFSPRRITDVLAVDGYRAMVDGAIGVVLFLFSYGPSLLLGGEILFFPARFAWRRVRQLGGKIFD